jgi:hypothetical protein
VCQVEKITTELEHKDQKAQNELNRIEFERERRRVIKEVRTEAHALSAARKKKGFALVPPPSLPPFLCPLLTSSLWQILESIQKKNERYEAIKTGEKTLRSMTDKMEEVMSKTKAEIRVCILDFTSLHTSSDTHLFPAHYVSVLCCCVVSSDGDDEINF